MPYTGVLCPIDCYEHLHGFLFRTFVAFLLVVCRGSLPGCPIYHNQYQGLFVPFEKKIGSEDRIEQANPNSGITFLLLKYKVIIPISLKPPLSDHPRKEDIGGASLVLHHLALLCYSPSFEDLLYLQV